MFSDNIVAYIRSNSHVDVPVICQEYSNAFQEKSDSLEKSPVKGDFSIDDGDTELNLLSPIASKNSEVCKMTAVDEILKNAALDLDQSDWDTSQSDVGSFSPVTTSGSSLSSTQDEESDDPEWKPSTFKSSSKGSSSIRRARNQEDRRLRKKEQNKCAATRYRLKKKAEVCELLREEEELKGKNKALKERVLDIEQEIRCLKGLMRDLFKIRGNRSVAS